MCVQSEVKQIITWRQLQASESKAEENQKVIDERRKEHQLQHREEMRVRHAAGFVRSNRKFMPNNIQIVDTHEGPQFSLVLKGGSLCDINFSGHTVYSFVHVVF